MPAQTQKIIQSKNRNGFTSPKAGVYGLIGAVGYNIFKCGNDASCRTNSIHSFNSRPVAPATEIQTSFGTRIKGSSEPTAELRSISYRIRAEILRFRLVCRWRVAWLRPFRLSTLWCVRMSGYSTLKTDFKASVVFVGYGETRDRCVTTTKRIRARNERGYWNGDG